MESFSPARLKTPLSKPLRIWLGIEVFFGVAAIGAVFLHPEATATNFAWPIQPPVMAATFGAFYCAVGVLFVLGMIARQWQQIRVVTLPAALFTAVMLLITFLHWQKFNVNITPFYVWFASYLLPPPLFILLFIDHQSRSAPVGYGRSQPIARIVRRIWLANGLLLLGLGVVYFIFPKELMAIAPWTFTPLTARTLCGWLIGVGSLQLGMAWEGDWPRVKIGTTMLMILPLTLLFQFWRFSAQVQWNNQALWLVLLDLSLSAILCLGLWMYYLPRSNAHRAKETRQTSLIK